MSRITRRTIGFAALAGLVLASAAPGTAVAQEKVVRIGHQKVGAFALLKPRGILEERLKPLGYTVSWKEFPTWQRIGDMNALRRRAANAPSLVAVNLT